MLYNNTIYIRDCYASVSRPVKELKGFKTPFVKAGETKTVTFEINEEMMKYYNIDMDYTADAGEFHLFIGRDCSVEEYTVFYLKNQMRYFSTLELIKYNEMQL